MTNEKPRVLGLITARGGSKRLPRKNLLPVGGKPLMAWTIEAARSSRCIDRLVLSTDDEAIASTAQTFGCEVPFRRPPALSTDEASSIDVVVHALQQLPGFTHFILLQPTSPLRSTDDIDAAFNCMIARGATSCVSVKPCTESPFWMYTVRDDGTMAPVASEYRQSRKQDLPEAFLLNGAIFISEVQAFLKTLQFVRDDTVPFVIPIERSLDIDNHEDMCQFETLLQSK